VSKFHLMDRTSPGVFRDKSVIVLDGLVRVRGGLVRIGFFSSTFGDYFERNLLTVNLMDPILLLLAL
jgi:hypothetical protein